MKHFLFGIITSVCIFMASSCKESSYQPVNLQCEHLVNPLGLDSQAPRLSWMLSDPRGGACQKAYQILIGTDSMALVQGQGKIWDTGKIESDNILITYKGAPLEAFTKYYWKVIYWDQNGKQSQPSAIASFEMGMISQSNWKGQWISDGKSIDYKPAPYFRKEINVNKEVLNARAYVATAGLYELSINGSKIGDRMLDPMYTRFDRRNLYSSFDITSQLKQGANAIGLLLGNGWYNHQSTAVWFFDKAPWRNRPRCCVDIRVTYKDGSVETFTSDSTWKTADSPVIFNSIYTAEHYDARNELPGWNTAGFDDKTWAQAITVDAPSGQIVAEQLHPIRITAELKPIKVDKRSDTCYIFTFPRNISGITRICVSGEAGLELRLKHGEKLLEDGYIDMSNIDHHYRPTDDSDPFQTDIFILNGKGENCFSPRFNYKGFQYVEIKTSKPIELTADNLTALVMHSDVPAIGSVHSSNPTLDKIWEATNNSYLSNLFGYPTDCPQREKNGWTGDSHIAIETGLYNFDAITVYEKWLNDFKDEQQPNGVLPNIIPTSGWGYTWANGPDWTSAVAIIPWEIYRFYGDSRLLENMYDNIKLYVNHIDSGYPEGVTDWGLGDWVPVKTVSSKELITSLYYYADVIILKKAALLFGKEADAKRYTELAEKIKNAVNAKFLNKETGVYCSGSQSEQATPLYWGVVPDELKAKVAANLYKKVEEADFHIDTGILGAKALLNVLCEYGYADAAYLIASQETYPSWGYWIVNGATTLYENWRLDVNRDASLNHIMFGEIGAWMYKGLGGIYPDENKPGFKHIILKPNFVSRLDEFEANHQSPYGMISTKWKRSGNKVTYEVTIPPNSTATLYLPGDLEKDNHIEFSSGKHTITQEVEVN